MCLKKLHDAKIILVQETGKSSDRLQPLDISCYKAVNSGLVKEDAEWRALYGGIQLTQWDYFYL